MPSCSASSRAWPISAIRWCWAATSTCCRPRSSSRSSARRTTRAQAAVLAIILLASHDRRVLPAAALAWPAQLHLGQRQGRRRHAPAAAPGASPSTGGRDHCRGALFTVVVYLMIVYGSFVQLWGRDNTLTIKHYLTAFSLSFGQFGLQLVRLGLEQLLDHHADRGTISAPLTAAIGLITAWLLTRQDFHGKRVFEFGTMLSFAIPGHGHRRLLHHRLQCAADRTHRHGGHPGDLLRVPQHAGRRARRASRRCRRSTRAWTRPR
jgi:hypothetical protein